MKTYEHPTLNEVTLVAAMNALSDPSRLQILHALMKGRELACHELPVGVAKATLSHHMGVLREAGLILTRVEGTKCLNTLRETEFEGQFPGLLKLVKAEMKER